MTDDFQRYLRAKRTVDDRALDRRLVDSLRSELAALAESRDAPLRVLEVGAGIGTMVERFLEWDVLPAGATRYTAVDVAPSNVRAVGPEFDDWADDSGYEVSGSGVVSDRAAAGRDPSTALEITGSDRTVALEAVAAEATAYVGDADRGWDVLVGAALLDVLGLDRLPALLSALEPGGCWYFPITFDGGTRFAPPHPSDRAVERYYHEHMDEKPGGDSRAGGHALDRLRQHPRARLLGAAGSDWVVRPRGDGYPGDEAYFLRHILGTVADALDELDRDPDLTDEALADWLAERRRQVETAELVYLTHQVDLLGRVDEP
jgi:hypothetical protein